MVFTRTTHTVRVKSADERFYADVEILDAISLTLPNGFKIAYNITPTNVVSPNIIDLTGDGNGKAGDLLSTRGSHMTRVTSTANSQMFFDYEVCDAFTLVGPNNAQHVIECFTPDPDSIPAITDQTGSGLAAPASTVSTRAQHVAKLLHQVGSGTAGTGQQIPTDYTLTLLTDAMSFQGSPATNGMPWLITFNLNEEGDAVAFTDYEGMYWGEQHVLQFYNTDTILKGALSPSANTNDITIYVTDPATDQLVPPPNTDPNVYVYFPPSTGGPFLGASPYTASGVPGNGPMSIPAIDMGPIWWLRALGAVDNVWFWYISPVQQPLGASFFGEASIGIYQWAYRGFVLLPFYPVIWILAENNPIIPMGVYGAPDLATAATGFAGSVNWFGVGYPDVNFGVSGGQPYMPFGAFDLTGPTAAEILAAPGDNTVYTDFGGPSPNIWELTGITQPPLRDTTLPWNATTNPHMQPSLALAQQVCTTFATKWNVVANAVNDAVAANPAGLTHFPGPLVPPPGWDWKRPYGGNTVPTAQMFSNGWIPPFIAEDMVPITLPTIAVGQLDPKVWNVEPVLSPDQNPPEKWPS